MKVIIIEDDFIVADHLKMMLKSQGVDVIGIIDNVEESLASTDLKPDLYFVDIRLAGAKTGIDFGEYLNRKKLPFVYLTANNELSTMKRAAQTKPFAYITKPYKESDIIAMLEIFKSSTQQTIEVKTSLGKKKLPFSDLLYIEAKGSYSDLVTHNKTYTERNSLSYYENELSPNFIRVHRSYIINKDKIEHYNSSSIHINAKEIPISRGYKNKIDL